MANEPWDWARWCKLPGDIKEEEKNRMRTIFFSDVEEIRQDDLSLFMPQPLTLNIKKTIKRP